MAVILAVISAIALSLLLKRTERKSTVAVKTNVFDKRPAKTAPAPESNSASVAIDSPEGLLQRWVAALRGGDLDAEMACYAGTVYVFYGEGPISVSDVRAHREKALAALGKPLRIDIDNVNFRPRGPSSVVVTFDESWRLQENANLSGRMKVHLSMRKTGEGWRITAETNLQTYHQSGPNPQA